MRNVSCSCCSAPKDRRSPTSVGATGSRGSWFHGSSTSPTPRRPRDRPCCASDDRSLGSARHHIRGYRGEWTMTDEHDVAQLDEGYALMQTESLLNLASPQPMYRDFIDQGGMASPTPGM